jgi:hypothetical protein
VAKGIYRIPDGQVMVDYGRRRAPVSRAQYKANGYQPSYEKLESEAPQRARVARRDRPMSEVNVPKAPERP